LFFLPIRGIIHALCKFRYNENQNLEETGVNLRDPALPPGWYPRDREEIIRFLRNKAAPLDARAAVAPHAGWFYSGAIAAAAVSALKQAETIAVLGGHLPPGMPPLFAHEEGVRTPMGDILIDTELRDLLEEELGGREDRYDDNTVEILLPMVRFFHPAARILWIRLPAEGSSFEAGKAIARAAEKTGRKVAVLGSTDLTHYGKNYGFSPRGSGREALAWVTEVNDRLFIKAVEGGDPAEILARAESDRSACSAGAVLGAAGYASAMGVPRARLLAYGASARAGEIPDSFVGYGAFAFGG
jgi:AmmeMemoRadiSam system protein B